MFFEVEYLNDIGKFLIHGKTKEQVNSARFVYMTPEELTIIKPELFLNYNQFKDEINKSLHGVK